MAAPQFVKTNEKGRPLDRTDREISITSFIDGSSVYYNQMTEDGLCRRSINARCLMGNTLDRRLGKVLLGTAGDAGSSYMSGAMQVIDGTDVLFKLVDGEGAGVQLQKWTGTEWSDVGTNIGTADDRVDWSWTSVNIAGEDRLYFTNGVSNLQYTNGTTVTEVSGIKAKYITNIGKILVIGHPTETWEGSYVLYSKDDSHQFYKDSDSGYSTSSNYFSMPGEVMQVVGFNSLLYVFTMADGQFEIDLNDLSNRQVSTHGTFAPKSVAHGWDMIAWCDQDGVWGMSAGGSPTQLSKKIDKLYNQVAYANISQIVAGFNVNGELEVHLGEITYEGVTYPNYTLIYEIEQSRYESQNLWREDTGREFPNNMVNWTNQYGFTQTYYGSRYTQSVFQTDYGYEDGVGVNIELTWISKDFKVVRDDEEATLTEVHIKYEPNGSETIPLSVYARGNAGAWQLLKSVSLPAGSTAIKTVRIPANQTVSGQTIAFKLVSSDDKALRIYEILGLYNYNNSTIPLTDSA